ncbi:trypsin-like peptidase domain-containing protein [Azohydromonas caseinilytica]|uniref:trypsin-like peptidase domain-containing protein n=1 Tax=Azohydromonas caseinilytica TaxID=2728836 RepID=UPI0035C0CD1E
MTSRHVLIDEPSQHFPDRIKIELHTELGNLTRSTGLSMLLYCEGKSVWRDGTDTGGEIDVAVIEIDRAALPQPCVLQAFTPAHLPAAHDAIEVGDALLVVGFPLGFHDGLHHLPVVRQAAIASSYGLRFQGKGYFLTDARTHRGTSGAPVLMRDPSPTAATRALPGDCWACTRRAWTSPAVTWCRTRRWG